MPDRAVKWAHHSKITSPLVNSSLHSHIFFLPQKSTFNLTYGHHKITVVIKKIRIANISISKPYIKFMLAFDS